MSIFAIADLHLAPDESKKMDIFGEKWRGHFDKIKRDWEERVSDSDAVLIAGDISWAMTCEEARGNIDSLCALPGKKLLLRGNHDYWWSSLAKVKALLSGDAYPVQNDCADAGEYAVCGTRGWLMPGDRDFSAEDEKIYEREKLRLRLSLDAGRKKFPDKDIIVMTHYPPLYKNRLRTGFTDIISEYNVKYAVFGHIHGFSAENDDFPDISCNGTEYSLVACDYLGFKLKKII